MSAPKKINILYLGIFLCVICAVATAVMAIVSRATAEPIAAAKERKVFNGLKTVLPEFNNELVKTRLTVKSASGAPVNFYTAEMNGKIVGYAAQAKVGNGYGGTVEGLVGFSPDGKITNYIISSHNETPGLGTRATNRTETRTIFNFWKKDSSGKLPANPILDQYIGHSAASGDAWKTHPWKLRKDGGDADHVTGATISSNAVCAIAWEAASAFEKNKAAIKAAASKNGGK